MKFITLRVPTPFATGPQYDEDGELVNGSWPSGLPHEGIKGWYKHGGKSGGLELCDFVAEDDYPIDDIPGGWRATSSHKWNFTDRNEYNEKGELINSAYDVELETNQTDYMKHYSDDTEYHRHHTYAGWPSES